MVKGALHNKNNNKILNLQNYKTILSSYKNIIILHDNIITNFKKPSLELRFKRRRELQDLSSNGSAFQTEGAAIVKDRPP